MDLYYPFDLRYLNSSESVVPYKLVLDSWLADYLDSIEAVWSCNCSLDHYKQYFDLFGSDAINSPQNYYQPPFQRSFEIAYKVWTNIKDGNGNTGSGYSKTDVGGRLGSFTSFNQSRLASQQFKTKSIEESAKVFQKVLNIFTHKGEPLIDFFNP